MKTNIIFGIIVMLLFIVGCVPVTQITDFESCARAGNPVMESYPRQCKANGQTFVEVLDEPVRDEKQIIGGCGTVTPGLEDACCENVMKDVPTILACMGSWKWNKETLKCEYKCLSSEDKYTAVKYKEDDQMKRILCESDEDCSFEKLTGSYSELNMPSCSAQLSCREGICVYSC